MPDILPSINLTALHLLLACAAITLGATLQAASGLGAGLIIVPLLALIDTHLVPGPMIFASMALSWLMSYRGRRHIRYQNMPSILTGLILGSAVAAVVIASIPWEHMELVFGGLILLAVAISLRGIKPRQRPWFMAAAGGLSGIMGTAAGIGAPVLALLYQYERGEVLRPTLGLLYFISSVVMLFVLAMVGRFGSQELLLGVLLMPGFILGFVVSPKLAGLLDGGYLRPSILLISSISATLLIIRGLLPD